MRTAEMLFRELVAAAKAAGRRCTFLGVGPVSETVVRAAFEAFQRHDAPAMFVASRNQVDLDALGGGYLMGGMDQHRFVSMLERVRGQTGYRGPLYICRDHGGPWQRDAELAAKLPPDRAMDLAKESFAADIEAAFNYLHVDPTKCPHDFTQADLSAWTVELIRFCEETRRKLGRGSTGSPPRATSRGGPIDYEVGTEDVKGGTTTPATLESFLMLLTSGLEREGLPLPSCVVGQTGTLTRMDRNVGRFDPARAAELAAVAARFGIGFKEHNADYLRATACRLHPELGVTAVNVAPEFALVETDACLELAARETRFIREGRLRAAEASDFRQILIDRTFRKSPWRKWLTDEMKSLDERDIETSGGLRLLIARVCGHYVYDDEALHAAREKLYNNVRRLAPSQNPERFVIEHVRDRVELYIKHFRLDGVNRIAELPEDSSP